MTQLTLDELIIALYEQDRALVLPRGFNTPHSFRGLYDELAFEPTENVTVGKMLAYALSARGETYTGHDGGEYTMTRHTPCWLALQGSSGGEEITPELLADMIAAGTHPTTPLADITLDPGMPDGTGFPGDSVRAQCANTTLHTMSSRGEIAWRDIVWAYLARAIAETDPARLRAALTPVVTTTNSWIAALDHRISSEPRGLDDPGMPDGTGFPGDSMRAQYADTTLHTKSSRGEIAWRDIVEAYLARAIAETDPARLRAALAPVATTTDSWIAALDHRISAEAVTGTQHPTSETTRSPQAAAR